MARVKWKYPEREEDHRVHLTSADVERTLCGLAFEGGSPDWRDDRGKPQDFVPTTKRADCPMCFTIWNYCKGVKRSDFADKMEDDL